MENQDNKKPIYSQEEETKSGDIIEEANKRKSERVDKIEIKEEDKKSGRISDGNAGWPKPTGGESPLKKGSSGPEEKDITD
jgi:hypothetical protein